MPAVVVDTDVVSYLFKRDSRAAQFRRLLVGQDTLISFMTLAELHRWSLARSWGGATWSRLERFLRPYEVCFADEYLCHAWAEVVHEANRKGRPLTEADAWIAATALALDIPLVTHNSADYEGVKGLHILST